MNHPTQEDMEEQLCLAITGRSTEQFAKDCYSENENDMKLVETLMQVESLQSQAISKAVAEDRKLRNRNSDGKYAYSGNWHRICECGHTLGNHTAESPNTCNDDGVCGCDNFRLAQLSTPESKEQTHE